jgi:hypothetical protein
MPDANADTVCRIFMKHHLVATMFCPVVVEKLPQPDTVTSTEPPGSPAALKVKSKSLKSKRKKQSGGGEKKPKKSKRKIVESS